MTNQITLEANNKNIGELKAFGFTQVAVVPRANLFQELKKYLNLDQPHIQLRSKSDGEVILIANELIDWGHFRATGEYLLLEAGNNPRMPAQEDTPVALRRNGKGELEVEIPV